ncbi:MAG: hypothetical protein KY432_05030 [Acidobacteria bacterium]|nr:hypothetical protein [Acidobacteriota bacterium]
MCRPLVRQAVVVIAVIFSTGLAEAGVNQWTPIGPNGGHVRVVTLDPSHTAEPTRGVHEMAVRRLRASGKAPSEAAPSSEDSGYLAVFNRSMGSGLWDDPFAMMKIDLSETPRYGPVTIQFDRSLSALYSDGERCTGEEVGVDSMTLPGNLLSPRIQDKHPMRRLMQATAE